jgi:FAD/FMN-containing dehydrogenase
MHVVTAQGKLITVTPTTHLNYFWALRGVGPNFGIVTSAVLKAYATPAEENMAWTGALIFTPDKHEKVVQAIQNLNLQPDMNIFMYFVSSGSPWN